MQQLNAKDNSLFKSLIKYYETKQYKKGIKAAEQILRKNPNHGETQAMKALILNSQGSSAEAFELGKAALKNDMKSSICWHVYGLLYRSQKNYEEAIKAYKFALRLEPNSQNILRDLALLQCQMRDYTGYIDSRRQIMESRATLRQNWTALAIAYHLAGDYTAAERVLKTYEETLKQPPSRTDLEHSEAALYRNMIIAESGDIEGALKHLETIAQTSLDRTAVLENRAKYLLDLGRKEEAQKACRALLVRNNEYRPYYISLEKALGLDREQESSHKELLAVYKSYAEKSDRADAPRRIPLDFLTGEAFKTEADEYLRRMLNKGVPSTFPNVRALYADPQKKAIIEELVLGYTAEEKKTNGSADGHVNGDAPDRFEESLQYFLAQHYNFHLSRDLKKAEEYIGRLIERNPKSVDYNMTKARIYKHYGNTKKAAETMNHARELDEKDRYINTKCAKYQLRNNENENALTTMSKFTRNETVGGPLGDLHDMQCMWYLTEDGEAYLRKEDLGLALKRFTAIADIFEVWYDDQFDFHSFSLRKGMIRAYIQMVRWENHLRDHPFLARASIFAVKIYLKLFDNPDLGDPDAKNKHLDAAERKKAKKQARKEQEKAEAEKKAAAAKKPAPSSDGEVKKEDTDPNGVTLIQTKTPLEDALKFLRPLLQYSPDAIEGQNLGFEVHLRRKKYLLAAKALLAARSIDADNAVLHEQTIRFRLALDDEAKRLASEGDAQSSQKVLNTVFDQTLDWIPKTADLAKFNDEWLQKHSQSAPHLQSGYKARYLLDKTTKAQNEKNLRESLTLPSVTIPEAYAGLAILDEWGSDQSVKEAYRAAAAETWPQATVFEKN